MRVEAIELKLKYLKELLNTDNTDRSASAIKDIQERIKRVCDSVEGDLRLNDSNKPSHLCLGCGAIATGYSPLITDGLACICCEGTMVPINSLVMKKDKSPPG